MKRIRRCIFLVTLLAALVPQVVGATARAPFACGGWSVVGSPSPYFLSALSGVAAVSPTDVWAVGGGGNVSYTNTLIEHWNGTSWQDVPPHLAGSLLSVTVVSANDVWAVGRTDGSQGASRTLAAHWDGTRWAVVPSPNSSQRANVLQGVAAISAGDVWAVGFASLNSNLPGNTLIEHWNGTQWSIVPSPTPGMSSSTLTAVTAVSSTDVWAVGNYFNRTQNQYALLTEHWDGTRWSIVPAAPSAGNFPDFTAVTSTDAHDVWATGFRTNQGGSLIQRWDGTRWHNAVLDMPHAFLYGIAAASPTNVWDVGGGASTVTLHFDGTAWTVVSSPNGPYSTGNQLSAVAMDSAQSAWAVGFSDDSSTGVGATLIEHYC